MGRRGRPPHPDILTPREWEVLELLRQGLSNPEIAQRLGISPAVARYHVSEILGKLAVESRQEAAAWRPVEGRRPWWTAALVPVTALWRQAGALPAGLSMAAAVVSGGLLVTALAGLGLMAFLLVRAGDGEGPRLAADSAAVPTATVEETARRTGIAEVDAILDAVESGEPDRVLPFLRYTQIPCQPPETGPHPFACGPEQAPGSPVDALPISICEEGSIPRDQADSWLRGALVEPTLYGVYRVPPGFEPPAKYVAVFSRQPQAGREGLAVVIDGDQIVKIFFAMPIPTGTHCAATAAQIVVGLGLEDAVLPPLATTQRRTRIAEIDPILNAVESGEPERVLALVRFTPIPCEPPTSVRGGLVVCEPDQEEGSPVDVISVSLCEESAQGRDDLDFYLRTYMVDPALYGVYRAPPGFEPSAQYVAVFSKAPHAWTEVLVFAIDDGEIVKIFFALVSPSGCAQTPATVVRGLGLEDALLPAPAVPSP